MSIGYVESGYAQAMSRAGMMIVSRAIGMVAVGFIYQRKDFSKIQLPQSSLCQPTEQNAPTVLENPMLPMPPIMETLVPPSLGLALMLTFPPVMETEALCLLNIPPLVAELEKLIMSVEELEKLIMSRQSQWYNPDGSINYPPNDGAVPGTETPRTLEEGEVVGRYGAIRPNSDYVTGPGAAPETLSLPPTTDKSVYQEFEVVRPIPGVIQSMLHHGVVTRVEDCSICYLSLLHS